MYEKLPKRRYEQTLKFLQKEVPQPTTVLDLGVRNPFTEIMEEHGYTVFNTQGEDLDVVPEIVKEYDIEVVTAFEIFEHLLAPFNVLREIQAKKLIATVPLKLWFANAYRSKTDMWDRHYHEFEDWQFDWLLEKSGWDIQAREKWVHPVNKLGIRPILRNFTPRYYAVSAQKID
ncbi:Methyltransferase [Tenacibaculum litopenaei]|uniref:methyltransferase n=1 Tax=Tenacibaculum litopenaei TaxID=396016 RepID=UPI003892F9B5